MRGRVMRRGFTLVELLVVLVLGGIIAGALGAVLRRQQRFFSVAASLVGQRVSLRDATSILPGELRSLAPGDVLAFSDSALEMRSTIGTAVVCDTVPGGGAIHLAPVRSPDIATWPRLSAFSTAPEPGDVALIYVAGETGAASDDAWAAVDVGDAASQPDACGASPFAGAALADASGIRLRIGGVATIPTAVRAGAFVRVLRRVRYWFYRAGTGDWFLGYSEWSGTAFGSLQPVSGPFASYSRGEASGLALRYFDESGNQLVAGTDASRVARVEVAARGVAREELSGGGHALSDSQSVGVRLRNR